MPATASIQWHVGTLRHHPHGGHWRNRSSYDWAATIRVIDAQSVELCGVDRPLNREMWVTIHRRLRAAGFGFVKRQRPDGRVRWIRLTRRDPGGRRDADRIAER